MDIKQAAKAVAEDFIDGIGDKLNDYIMGYMDENNIDNLPMDVYDKIIDDAHDIITEHFKQ